MDKVARSDHSVDKQRSFVDHNSIRSNFASLPNVEKNWEMRRELVQTACK